jgi:hypothetical protein
MSNPHFRIPRASIQSVERREPGKTSVGDRATVRLEPGILPFLETRIAGIGIPLGAGYQAPWNVPFGIAATAAYALVAPLQSATVYWTGFDVEIEWQAAADLDDALLSEAEVTAVDQGLACFTIRSRTTRGRPLFTGRLRLRAVSGGKAVPTALLLQRPAGGKAGPTPEAPSRMPGYSLLASVDAPAVMELGRRAAVRATLANDTDWGRNASVALRLPPGAGLSLEQGDASIEAAIAPHSVRTVQWTVRADRPHEVNLQKPWPVEVVARAEEIAERYPFQVSVPDPRPGRIFYILNEDCETFDGGPLTGDYADRSMLGNANNFMDPEDYRVQMIEKPDRMNAVAERHGARWTHFWCVPQRFAVDWASAQSHTGEWPKLAAAMDESVRRGSVRHEYAPHIHFDYEPDSRHPPQPRLVYDVATDGILPNQYYDPVTNPRHHYHDWDGSARGISYIKVLGDLADSDSKAGSLYKCALYLARMQANRRYPLIGRTGTFDFGIAAEDQAISTAAYQANGLRVNSDARFGYSTPPRGIQAYWCSPADRMCEVDSLEAARLVQLAIPYETDFRDPGEVNGWFTSAVQKAPGCGVHIVAAMTHAMFMRGEPDAFRSMEGGSFAGLDQHLAWVRSEHPEVEFATATEAMVEFLDYYTPKLEAYAAPVLCGGNPQAGVYEYGVRLLGAGIRVDERHPAQLQLLPPPLFKACDVERLRVVAGGEILAEESCFDPSRRPAVAVTLTRRPDDLRLQVVVKPAAIPNLAALHDASGLRYEEPPEAGRGPLFELALPRNGDFAANVLRMLMNPVAGASEPLGRRIHPLGVFVMGAALTAALESAGEGWQPRKLWLRWRKELALDADLRAVSRPLDPDRLDALGKLKHTPRMFEVRMRDHRGDVVADSEVELRAVAPAILPPTPAPDDQRYTALLAGIRQYDDCLQERLAEYRGQRAWKVMLWIRSAYTILFRQGWGAFFRWLPHSFSAAHEDLTFPKVSDFVDR